MKKTKSASRKPRGVPGVIPGGQPLLTRQAARGRLPGPDYPGPFLLVLRRTEGGWSQGKGHEAESRKNNRNGRHGTGITVTDELVAARPSAVPNATVGRCAHRLLLPRIGNAAGRIPRR